jgi:hypothetical protein
MAFKMTWKEGWYLGNPGLNHLTDDLGQPYGRAFEAIGYAYELLHKKDSTEPEFRERIVESIRDRHHPVIARGVVGPPEECMIVGFDKGGEVLIGWSYFQAVPEFSEGVEFEPSGYFRKKGWFADTESIVLLEGKVDKPSAEQIYNKALSWALVVSRTTKVKEDFHSGHAAYDAWAKALGRHEDLLADNMAVLRVNYGQRQKGAGTEHSF